MLEATHVLSERIVLNGEVGGWTVPSEEKPGKVKRVGATQINNLSLDIEEAEELHDQLESALREAGVIPVEVPQEPLPRHGVVIDGLGGPCLNLTNYGDKPVRVTLANAKDVTIDPRESVPVWGAYLASATIVELR